MNGTFGAPPWPISDVAMARARKQSAADVQVAFTPHSMRYLSLEPTRLLPEMRAAREADASALPQPTWQSESAAALDSIRRLPWHRVDDPRNSDGGATCSSLGVDSEMGFSTRTPATQLAAGSRSARIQPLAGPSVTVRLRAENRELHARCDDLARQLVGAQRPPSRARLGGTTPRPSRRTPGSREFTEREAGRPSYMRPRAEPGVERWV
jgi:ribosomal protein L34E